MPAAFISFVTLLDNDGSVLDGGKLWIGAAGKSAEANPVNVFWDQKHTEPAQQPIQVENGIVRRDGHPAIIFVDRDHSITVRNRFGWITASEATLTSWRIKHSSSQYVDVSLVGYVANTSKPQKPNVKDGAAISARELGIIADWDGVSGTDNSAAVMKGIRLSAASGRPFVMDLANVGASCIDVRSISGWAMEVQGSIYSTAKKPAVTASDARNREGGRQPLFKIDNCNGWRLSGATIDPRFREAFVVTRCSDFQNSLEIKGTGVNDNLEGCLYRYCKNFEIGQKITSATRKPDTGYLDWANAVTLWDCSHFKVTSSYSATLNGGNGLYIGSNCSDFLVESGATCISNSMSGIQLAWSSFGDFPTRFEIGAMRLLANGADGLDVNNTNPKNTLARLDAKFTGHIGERNGFGKLGRVTADGSGIGTFANVSHFTITDAVSTDSARAGFYARNCSNFSVAGRIRKMAAQNNVGEGIYLESCRHYRVTVDAATRSDQEVVKLYGHHVDGRVSGKLRGIIAIPTPDPNTSYKNVSLIDCEIDTTSTVVGHIEVTRSKIKCSTDALRAFKDVSESQIESTNGIGLIFAASGVKVSGGTYGGTNSGTHCDGMDNCSLINGANVFGKAGPASHWINASKSTIAGCTIEAKGNAKALRVDARCTDTYLRGNTILGINDLSGTYLSRG